MATSPREPDLEQEKQTEGQTVEGRCEYPFCFSPINN